MLRVVLMELKEESNSPLAEQKKNIYHIIHDINPHILILGDTRKDPSYEDAFDIFKHAGIFSSSLLNLSGSAERLPGISVLAKFPIHKGESVQLVAEGSINVDVLKTSFDRPLGKFDLYITDFRGSAMVNVGQAGEFLRSGEPLAIIIGCGHNRDSDAFNPFADYGFVSAPIDTNGSLPHQIWLSEEIARDFNKLEYVSIAGSSAMVIESNIRMPELHFQ